MNLSIVHRHNNKSFFHEHTSQPRVASFLQTPFWDSFVHAHYYNAIARYSCMLAKLSSVHADVSETKTKVYGDATPFFHLFFQVETGLQ